MTAPIEIREATLAEVPSLTTIVKRSFHPVNPYIKGCFPDTPAVAEWWTRVYTDEINAQDCHVLIAYDPSAEIATRVVGILCLRLMQANDRSGGFMSQYELTPDHDASLLIPAVDTIIKGRKKAFEPPGKYAGQKNYLLELFGVDHDYKGRGLARKLLEAAGGIADEAGLVTFVEANAKAAPLYVKLGFEDQGSVEMPGSNGYMEHLMIRPAFSR